MNAGIFRLVFSRTPGVLVPASELTRARGPRGSRTRIARRAAAVAIAMTGGLAVAQTMPAPNTLPVPVIPITEANIAASGAAAAQVSGSTLTVNQSTARDVIEWNSFDIGNQAAVVFNHQQGASSATLNRIVGTEQSIINGALSAQGQVYIINGNGVLDPDEITETTYACNDEEGEGDSGGSNCTLAPAGSGMGSIAGILLVYSLAPAVMLARRRFRRQ